MVCGFSIYPLYLPRLHTVSTTLSLAHESVSLWLWYTSETVFDIPDRVFFFREQFEVLSPSSYICSYHPLPRPAAETNIGPEMTFPCFPRIMTQV